MPTPSSKELEDLLSAAGNCLLQHPSSVDELLSLLDRIEELLSKVEQSPLESMQNAISPLMKALVVEELLKHADADVKVGVASCISEITRITAPDAPYDDDKMKDVFQLIVSSFENLWDTSSRSYEKRATILETVAKVRSCVIMLDLECDQMIIEMFQHFLNAIRDYHADVIFTSMEAIMNLVLEESEDVAPNLLSPILNNLKQKNEAILPIAKKLAERVFCNCSDKIRPYLAQAIKTIGASLDDYTEIVASVYRENTNADGHSNESISKDQSVVEKKSISASSVQPPVTQVANNGNANDTEETSTQDINATVNTLPKSFSSNGVNGNGIEETLTDANYSKKEIDSIDQSGAKSMTKTDSDDSGVQELLRQGHQVGPSPDRNDVYFERDLVAPSDLDGERQPEHVPGNQEMPDKDVHTSPDEICLMETAKTLDKLEETSIKLSPSKAAENMASPAISADVDNESRLKKSGRAKRKENLVQEETATVAAASKASEEHASEEKKQRRMGKRQFEVKVDKGTTLIEGDLKNDSGDTSDSEARSLDEILKVGNADKKMQDVPLSKKENRKKSGRVKPKIEKGVLKSSAREDHGSDMVTSPRSPLKPTKTEDDKEETPRISNKRKRTPGTDKAPATVDYGENLVGSKVKVWWPKDRMFYEGVIASFDSVKKKHKVFYTDGDKEVLNLRRERWEFVGDDSASDGAVENSSHDISFDISRKRKGASNSEISIQLGKLEGSPRSKVKDMVTKSGSKFKSEGKVELKSKDSNQKSSGQSEDHTGKFKDRTPKVGGRSHDDSAKASGRYKDADASKYSPHSKQDSQRTAKSKGKSPQCKTLGAYGTEVTKSSSSRVKESDRMKEKTLESAKSLQMGKGKSPDIAKHREKGKSVDIAKAREKGKSTDNAKSRESGTRSGKKRRR